MMIQTDFQEMKAKVEIDVKETDILLKSTNQGISIKWLWYNVYKFA